MKIGILLHIVVLFKKNLPKFYEGNKHIKVDLCNFV